MPALKPHPDAKPCGSCGAPIFFARVLLTQSGDGPPDARGANLAPFDAVPQMRAIQVDGIPSDGPLVSLVRTYVSHFATCPNAAQHRKAAANG